MELVGIQRLVGDPASHVSRPQWQAIQGTMVGAEGLELCLDLTKAIQQQPRPGRLMLE